MLLDTERRDDEKKYREIDAFFERKATRREIIRGAPGENAGAFHGKMGFRANLSRIYAILKDKNELFLEEDKP